MQVRWTRPAAQDLERIALHIRQNNPAVALRVARTIYDRCMGLQMFPNRGRNCRIAGTRELIFAPLPYIAVYRVKDDRVEFCASIIPRKTGRKDFACREQTGAKTFATPCWRPQGERKMMDRTRPLLS